jgi:predicted flavoprotein YhiN
MKSISLYDVAVIGGGAAGCMAAIKAGQLKKRVVLLERNDSLGRKILLTSNGRCNLTNIIPIEEFINKFIPNGEFYRTAFHSFSNTDLMGFFRAKDLDFKVEDRGRVLPVTDRASSIVQILEKYLKENNVDVLYGSRIISIENGEDCFFLSSSNQDEIKSKKIIISTGGVSYKATGSSGDGFDIVKKLGHTITELKPALVPLKVKESFVKELQGISFENVQITIYNGNKKNISDIGDMIFTHFGISGPLVLDISGEIISLLKRQKEINPARDRSSKGGRSRTFGEVVSNGVKITIDFMPNSEKNSLETKLAENFKLNGKLQIKNVIQEFLPKRMVPVFLELLNIQSQKLVNQISKKERILIVDSLKAFSLTIIGNLSIDEAMVTSGGVSMREINPRTMESKIVPGLYFAGEVIEAYGVSGGYNLQQAFSTGYLAGESASR